MVCKVANYLFMNIMLNFKKAGGGRVRILDRRIPNVLGVLNCGWKCIQISSGIKIKIGHMVSKGF
jgi:hypothetical protein